MMTGIWATIRIGAGLHFLSVLHESRQKHLIRRLPLLLGGLIQQLQRRQGCDAFGSLSIQGVRPASNKFSGLRQLIYSHV